MNVPDIIITNFCWCYNPPSNDKVWGSFVKLTPAGAKHFVFWGKRNSKGQQKINIQPQYYIEVNKKYLSKVKTTNPPDKLYQDMCVDLKQQIRDIYTKIFPARGFPLQVNLVHLIYCYANLNDTSFNSQDEMMKFAYAWFHPPQPKTAVILPSEEQKQQTWQSFMDLYQTHMTKINSLYSGFEDEIINELLIYTLEN